MNKLEKQYGIVEERKKKFYIKSSEKNSRMDYLIDDIKGIKAGDYVSYALVGAGRFKEVKIIKNYGAFDLNKATATLILEKYDIPRDFSKIAIDETEELPEYNVEHREDLRHLPFVTIDGDDSKDFDDAVYAQPIFDGHFLIVAIADVAFYVRPGMELDRDAYKRGNSVYLPNIVVPMLPEKLSNDLCSLRPHEVRPTLACFMEIDLEGNIRKYDFKRALIKSQHRLTYKEVQEALDSNNKKLAPIINPLYEAYNCLRKAREKRGALELETTEIKIKVDNFGHILSVTKDEHYVSHEIIEEFMIAANVSAAKALKRSKLPTMYRIHEKPMEDKLVEIKPLLKSLNMKLPDINSLKPEHLNKVLRITKEKGYSAGISDLILRLQSQARYSPDNIGHFGLGLDDYVHFTSPIRRYSDLLVHRALIKYYKMPEGGGLEDNITEKTFKDIGEHLGVCERRAVNAERDLEARFLSAYMEPSIGADFEVKVSGISTAGMFVRVESIGAEGLIPMRTLPDDNYNINEASTELYASINDRKFKYGDVIKARLMEASPITGGLIFKYIDPEEGIGYFENKYSQGVKKRNFKKAECRKKQPNRKNRKSNIKKSNRKKKK